MSTNLNEAGVIFHKVGGHNHDGKNSTKIDFSTYSDADLASIIERLRGSESLTIPATSSGSSSSSSAVSDSIYFHMPGDVGLSPDIVAQKVFLYATSSIKIYGTLGSVGSGPTVVTIYKNRLPVGSITIEAGNGDIHPVIVTINAIFNGVDDMVSARVTTAGEGATELGIEIVAIAAQSS